MSWRDGDTKHKTLTGTQHRILAMLRRGAGPITGRTIHDTIMPNVGMKNVHVHIHRMRQKGVKIEKVPNSHGYILVEETS